MSSMMDRVGCEQQSGGCGAFKSVGRHRSHIYECVCGILSGLVRSFRECVEIELPGLFAWFDDNSLHVTIRALMG